MSQPPSKKRIADNQISQLDPESEVDDDNGEFQKASDEVLSARRIVKARRAPVRVNAPNAFSNISFTTNPASISAPAAVKKEETKDDSVEAKVESKPGAAAILATNEDAPEEEEVESKAGTKEPPSEVEKVENATEGEENKEVQDDVKQEDSKPVKADLGNSNQDEVESNFSSQPPVAENGFSEPKSASLFFSQSSSTPFSTASGSNFNLFSTQSSFAFSAFSSSGSSFSFQSTGSLFSNSNGLSSFSSFSTSSSLFDSSNHSSASLESTPAPSFTPVVTLKEVKVETGEENEENIFSEEGSYYEHVEGNWKRSGKGLVKVNVPINKVNTDEVKTDEAQTDKSKSEEKGDTEEKKSTVKRIARLVMRADSGNFRLLLNSNLYPGLKIQRIQNRVVFSCINTASENSTKMLSASIKFTNESAAGAFVKAVEENLPKE